MTHMIRSKNILLSTLLLLSTWQIKAQEKDSASFVYRKPLFDFDYKKTPFKLENEQLVNKNRFLRFSVLTGYREGVEPVKGFANFGGYTDTLTGTRRVYMYNLSIQDMLTHGMLGPNQVVLEVNDPSKYRYDPSYGSKESWLRKNGNCYEFMLPAGTIQDIKVVEDDLANILGVKFGNEKRLVKALVLVRTSNIDKIKATGKGNRGYDMLGHFINVPINRIGHALYEAGMPPFVDETGYKDAVDLNLNIKSWTDLPTLRLELQRYDLDLKEEMREVEMFVITENNWKKKT
jgi:hypothetical protein